MLKHELHDHIIHFQKNERFLIFVLYDINQNEILKFRRYLNKNFNKKFIRVNRFDAIVSILFVKKLEKKIRFYMNYRNLNVVIVKNRYFLSLIFEILNRFNRVKIFIKLNIIIVFNRFCIREENETFIAFHIRFELFEYLIILFNLCNEFAFFQNYINDIFHKYIDNFCIVYLDNILIYNDNEAKHEFHVRHVLQKFHEIDLQINIIKCVFHVQENFYLKLIIIIEKFKMNLVKIDVIIN